MGGGGRAGGSSGLLRNVGRGVTTRAGGAANLQEPISSSSSTSGSSSINNSPASPAANSRPAQDRDTSANQISLSGAVSSPFSSQNISIPAHYGVPSWSSFGVGSGSFCDDYEWVSVDGSDDDKAHGFLVDEFVLGPVPSLDEVNTAVSALQQ